MECGSGNAYPPSITLEPLTCSVGHSANPFDPPCSHNLLNLISNTDSVSMNARSLPMTTFTVPISSETRVLASRHRYSYPKEQLLYFDDVKYRYIARMCRLHLIK
jgi:hypothetical protein